MLSLRYNVVACILALAALFVAFFTYSAQTASAQGFEQINYQGKLTLPSGVAVPDGTYNMRFWIIASGTAATGTAEWTEELTGSERVQVTNGLFSVMLGSTSPLTTVPFDMPLWLGVEIGGTGGSPTWDGEMSPRKVIGMVPAAFVATTAITASSANTLSGIASSSFLRSDEADTMDANSASPLLTLIQQGVGKVVSFFSGAAEVFTILADGKVGVSSSTPGALLSVQGNNGSAPLFLVSTSTNGTGTTTPFAISAAGNVGVGTTTPGTQLVVQGQTQFWDVGGDAPIIDINGALSMMDSNIDFYSNGNLEASLSAGTNEFTISDSNSMRLRVNDGGSIQLRTAAGGAALDVSSTGDTTLAGSLAVSGAATVTGTSTFSTTTISRLTLGSALAATSGGTGLSTITQNQLLIGAAGNTWTQIATSSLGLGNGTFLGLTDTPSSYTANRVLFTNSGGTAVTDSANFTFTGSLLSVNGSVSSGYFTATSSLATSTFAGAVGIGTTSSRYPLEVGRNGSNQSALIHGSVVIGKNSAIAPSTNANIPLKVAGEFSQLSEFTAIDSTYDSTIRLMQGEAGVGSVWRVLGGTQDVELTTGVGHLSLMPVAGKNVAIGTSSPWAKLSVQNTYGATAALFDVATTTSAANATSSLFRVLASGNVGVGTSSPAAKLGVNGLTLADNFRAASTTATSTFLGPVGFGTSSPISSFVVTSNNAIFQNTSNGTSFRVNDSTGSYILAVDTSGSLVSVGGGLSVSGQVSGDTASFTNNVGIGSSTPSHKLTVVGNTYIGGNLRLTGALLDSTAATGTLGMVLQTTGTSTRWVATSTLGISSGATTFLALTDTPSSYTANRVLFTNSGATAVTDSANFVFTGTNLGLGTTTPTARLTVANSGTSTAFAVASSSGKNLFRIRDTGFVDISLAGNPVPNFSSLLNVATDASGDVFNWGYNLNSSGDVFGSLGVESGTDTYLRYANSDFKFYQGTGSNEIMRLTAAGNVGVGTSSPAAKFSVAGLSLADYFRAASTTATSTFMGAVGVGTTSPAARFGVSGLALANNFRAASTTATSTFAGPVGFGTSSPISGFTVASNNVVFQNTSDNAGAFGIYKADGTYVLAVETNTSASFFGGSIYAGNPVFGVNGSETNPAFTFNNDTDTGIFGSGGSNYLGFTTGGTEKMRINSDGNVGIGTTTPYAKLTVAGGLGLTGALLDSTAATGTLGMVLQSTGTSTRWVATSTLGISSGASTFLALTDTPSSYTANRVLFTNSGATAVTDSANFVFTGTNLGLGTTTPGSRLTVVGAAGSANPFLIASSTGATLVSVSTDGDLATAGDIYSPGYIESDAGFTVTGGNAYRFGSTGSARISGSGYNAGGDYVQIQTANTARLHIDNSGNVGIGSTSPAALLGVNGLALADYFRAASTTATSSFAGNAVFSNAAAHFGFGTTTPVSQFTINGNRPTSTVTGYIDPQAGVFTVANNNVEIFTAGANAYNQPMIYMPAQLLTENIVGINYGSLALTPGSSGAAVVMTDSNGAAPNAVFMATGEISFGTTTITTASTFIQSKAGLNPFAVASSSGSSLLTLTQAGNLGIGTTSPAARLGVNGLALADYFRASSVTATSTFAGPVGIGTSSPISGFTVASNNVVFQNTSNNANAFTVNKSDGTSIFAVETNTSASFFGGSIYAGNPVFGVNGSETDPSFTFNNDPDTGIFGSGGSNYIGFTTAGTEAMRVNSSGALLIGTVTQSGEALVATGYSNSLPAAYIENTHNDGAGLFIDVASGGTNSNQYLLDVAKGGTSRFSVLHGGNVGIASSTPSHKLTVVGNSYIGGNLRLTGALLDSTAATGTLGMVLQTTGTSTRWVATSTLGITASLSGGTEGFLARWTSASALSTGLFRDNGTVAGVNATSSSYTFNVQGGAGVNAFNVASSSGTSIFAVTSNSRVGIGSTTPSHTLSVNGTAGVANLIAASTTAISTITNRLDVGATAGSHGNAGTLNIRSLGSATSLGFDNDSLGEASIIFNNSLYGFTMETHTNSIPITIRPNGQMAAYFNDSGNAAIGTSTLQAARLTIDGGISLSGALLDSTRATGTLGMVLQSTGTSTRWVATSTLGITGGASTFLALTDTPSSYTANRIMYTNSGATALTDSANLVFTGTRLGIGSTTPTAVLTVAGTTGSTELFAVASTTASDYFLSVNPYGETVIGPNFQGNATMYLNTDDTTYAMIRNFSGSGATEFASDGSLTLDVDGDANDSSNSFTVRVNGSTEIIKALDTGNVGIGTSTPAAKLGVDGLVLATHFRGASTTATSTFAGALGIGTSTPFARSLTIDRSSINGTTTAGIGQYLAFANSSAGAQQFGNSTYIKTTNTATTTLVGSILRLEDSTTYGNTLRGFEVQTERGTNTQGENTAISGFARTFGVRGVTEGDAGGTYEPAGVYGETRGTTQGNAIRGYSSTITTAALLKLFQDTSTFTGTGLLMNFGNSGGSFSSTTASKFIDLQNAGTSRFTVGAYGALTIGDGTTNNNAGIQIGYGGLCVDNDGSCNASTTGRISSVSTATGNSDLAEMYFSSDSLLPGEVVYLKGGLSVGRASQSTKDLVIGVVSTLPGLIMGENDASLRAGEEGHPIALKGRVPVRVSNENGEVKKGDELMLSSVPGVVMKASSTGTVVGIALEDYEETRAYSDTFINQFGESLIVPDYTPINRVSDPRINDGCYYGGGSEAGEAPCVPLRATTTVAQYDEADAIALAEAKERALRALARESSARATAESGEEVRVGQIIMFVDLRYRYLDAGGEAMVAALGAQIGTDATDTVWSRLVTLASNFVDGVLSVFTLKADRVETNELCVDGVCVTADDLRTMLEGTPQTPEDPAVTEGEGDSTLDVTDGDSSTEETSTSTESGVEVIGSEVMIPDEVDQQTEEQGSVSTPEVTADEGVTEGTAVTENPSTEPVTEEVIEEPAP